MAAGAAQYLGNPDWAPWIEFGANQIYGTVHSRMEAAHAVAQGYFGPSQSNLHDRATMAHKRARHEPDVHAEGMEPEGHGNAPATGTHLGGFVEKFVPVNFPDKFTVKEKYCSAYMMRSTGVAGTTPTQAYIVMNTNSNYAPINSTTNSLAIPNGAHQPNQRDNWAAQYGYYRVTDFEYKISCSNVSNVQFTETAGVTFVNPIVVSDAILTLQKTQTISDITSTTQETLWEQKQCHNVFLQARSPGSVKTYHEFTGHIKSEEFDMDPLQTAADETWTVVGASPATNKLLALSMVVLAPETTVALLPEAGVLVFIEIVQTVQYAGYSPSLRHTMS